MAAFLYFLTELRCRCPPGSTTVSLVYEIIQNQMCIRDSFIRLQESGLIIWPERESLTVRCSFARMESIWDFRCWANMRYGVRTVSYTHLCRCNGRSCIAGRPCKYRRRDHASDLQTISGGGLYHYRKMCIRDRLSDWSLERSAVLLGYIADRLGNIESFPFERKVPE